MKYLLPIFLLILCSCLSEEEIELENTPLSSSSSSIEPIQFEPCPNDSVEPNPLISECPPEDISECPILELPDDWMDTTPDGGCPGKYKISKKELSFDAQGGVRCITVDRNNVGVTYGGTFDDNQKYGCTVDEWGLKCSWLAATDISNRAVYISVDKNETGKERKYYLKVGVFYCWGDVLITQSAE